MAGIDPAETLRIATYDFGIYRNWPLVCDNVGAGPGPGWLDDASPLTAGIGGCDSYDVGDGMAGRWDGPGAAPRQLGGAVDPAARVDAGFIRDRLAAALAYVAVGPAVIAYRCWGLGVQRSGPAMAGFFRSLGCVDIAATTLIRADGDVSVAFLGLGTSVIELYCPPGGAAGLVASRGHWRGLVLVGSGQTDHVEGPEGMVIDRRP